MEPFCTPSRARTPSADGDHLADRLRRLASVVAAPSERARLDVTDPVRLADRFPAVEFVRLDPTVDRQVMRRRAQVLTDGDDVDADRCEVEQHAVDLVAGLSEPNDQARL